MAERVDFLAGQWNISSTGQEVILCLSILKKEKRTVREVSKRYKKSL